MTASTDVDDDDADMFVDCTAQVVNVMRTVLTAETETAGAKDQKCVRSVSVCHILHGCCISDEHFLMNIC